MTQTCVSLTNGTISSDQRVNYAHGMVLGVDEFLTEQQHRLEKGYLHERALHGYGTVYGLHVTAETAAEDSDDVTVTVSTGMAIDQYGREVVINCAQCARLGAWLAAQEQANPGTVVNRRGPSGELIVYVVARYASCLDNLVPLPGTPCTSSAETSVASRVRDAWDVDLTFDRPPMPRWDTDRRLARLLGSVEIVAGLPPEQSNEDQIIDAVHDLVERADEGPDNLWPESSPPTSPPGLPGYQLPAETAAEALDRIFTVWITQVRPQLQPDLSDPELPNPTGPDGTDAILLATIRFLAADPFDGLHPVITNFDEPDDAGRPYLLHTGLIQELRSLKEPDVANAQPRELVTLAAIVDQNGRLSLDAWFQLKDPVALPGQIEVFTESGVRANFSASATDANGNPVEFSHRWRLTAPAGFAVIDNEQLWAVFPGPDVKIGNRDTSLADLQAGGVVLLNSIIDGSVVAYATVQIDEVAAPNPPVKQQASAEFVTVTSSSVEDKQLQMELWFHPQPRGVVDNVFLVELGGVLAFDEVTGKELTRIDLRQDPNYRNVWTLVTEAPTFPAYVRLIFITGKITVDAQGSRMQLAEWIKKADILFVGMDPKGALIVAFTRVAELFRP
jgi:hypothetical protein